MTNMVDHVLAGTVGNRMLDVREHHAVHGPLPRIGGEALIDELARAGLAGRGGAGFPTAQKLTVVARGSGPKTVIANAAETEPMSQKDRALVELTPHLVLDGLELAGRAVGAKSQVLALGARSAHARKSLELALRDRNARRTRIVTLPDHYLAGQETALLSVVGGGKLKPRVVPPFPAERGIRGGPTLIQNVETLAHLALIARHGADWFRAAGTDSSPGSVLVTLDGAVEHPGVYEVRGGSRIGDILEVAGGPRESLRALLVGGYFGAWLGPHVADMRLDASSLADHGATLGTGVLVALDERHCPVAEVTRVASWMAAQSAGQCGPCSNGLPAIARELTAIQSGRARQDSRRLIARWTGLVQRRGACHHPDGMARFVATALDLFAPEFQEHARRGPCDRCAAPPALVATVPRSVAA